MTKFNKYLYLGSVIPEVPETWNDIILNMLKNIDRIVKPWYIPRFILKYRLGREVELHNHIFNIIHIDQIKQKFGTLRVYASSSTKKVNDIIADATLECNNTCEFCGNKGTSLVTIKNWVRNICSECIEKHKK